MNLQQKYLRNIKLDYVFIFFRNLIFSNAIWMIYLINQGFTLFQIGIVEAIFHVTGLIMETPTGAIADLYGRKFSRMCGLLFNFLYLGIMIYSSQFIWVAFAFVLLGLSYNLESGAGDALVYDSLKCRGEEEQYLKVNGRREMFYQIAKTIGIVVGGYVALTSYKGTFILNSGAALGAVIAVLLMAEPNKAVIKEKQPMWNGVIYQFKTVFQIITNHCLCILFISIVC